MEDYRSLGHTKWQCKYHSGIHQGQACDSRGEALLEERAKLNYARQRIGARNVFVDTVGRHTETIRKYIAERETEDRRLDVLEMPEITRE